MPLDPACSRVEPPGGQGKEGAADGGEVWVAWVGLEGPGSLETRDLATQGSGTRAARPATLQQGLKTGRETERGVGRLAGWRVEGGLPPADADRRSSVAFPLEASRWAGALGPGVPPLSHTTLSRGLLRAWAMGRAGQGSPTILAPAQSSNSRCEEDRCAGGPQRLLESGIAPSPRLAESASHHRGRRHPPTQTHTYLSGSP